MTIAIIILIIVIIILKVTPKPFKEKKFDKKNKIEENQIIPYKKKYLFTKAEYNFYWKLKEIAEKHNLIIFTKVRLADIIETTAIGNQKQTYFNKIKSKHIDFVLCDEKLNIKTLIELDDYTHKQENRKERDTFVDKAINEAGYKIIHVTGNYEKLEEQLQLTTHIYTIK